jgi:5'-nucleotidase
MSSKIVNRVLLSNDDGIDAPGMAILEQIAKAIAHEVWIVAPAQDRSGVSNSLSLREPVRIIKRDIQKYAVYGTPADCVAFALHQVMADNPPDLVLTGVNYGSNIGFVHIPEQSGHRFRHYPDSHSAINRTLILR